MCGELMMKHVFRENTLQRLGYLCLHICVQECMMHKLNKTNPEYFIWRDLNQLERFEGSVFKWNLPLNVNIVVSLLLLDGATIKKQPNRTFIAISYTWLKQKEVCNLVLVLWKSPKYKEREGWIKNGA